MSKLNKEKIESLIDHPKAHQILNHLNSLSVKDAAIDIKVRIENSWIFLAVNEPITTTHGTYQDAIFQTTMSFVEGQMAFIYNTYTKEKYQGKGVYGLVADLRDRIIEQTGAKFMSSMIRNDNDNMQKAALKAGWKKAFVGTNHCIFIKEVLEIA